MGEGFEFLVLENGQRIDGGPIADPFIHTTIRPRGLRSALRVLFGRLEFKVHVSERILYGSEAST